MAQGVYANMHHTLSGQTLVPSQVYSSYAASTMQPEHANVVDNLADSFGNVNLRQNSYIGHDSSAAAYMPANGNNPNTPTASKANGQLLYQLSDGSYAYSGPSPAHPTFRPFPQQLNWPPTCASPYQAGAFQRFPCTGTANGLNTPRGQQWAPHNVPPVPELVEPRRTSWSSHDEPSPQTPTFAPGQSFAYMPGQSPAAYSTPSPMSASQSYYPHIWKNSNGDVSIIDFWEVMNREPAIPEAVPALRSGPDGGRGTLDKILDNRDGTTNVYVRGLQPDTSDDMLAAYGARFGPVVSCKAIIEMSTNQCKGFGFIKYHNYIDAENCIRGFYHRGYEAKFARKSHNSRLKDLASPENTNLYVSNLPRLITEAGLQAMFASVFPKEPHPNHQAGSCKILKDSCGVSRGVGFARFETPEICEEIIEAFNNRQVGEGKDVTVIQIRYADTEEQKKLKQFTAVKRQFKTDEYNEVVHGIPFNHYSPNTASYQSPLQGRFQGVNGHWTDQSPASSVSPASINNYPYSVLRSRQASSLIGQATTLRPGTDGGSLPADRHSARIKIESPSVTAAAKKAAMEASEDTSTDGGSSIRSRAATMVENTKPAKSFTVDEVLSSPTKSKL
ncbi:MAG: hypothetical protein Q9217_004502 [Psora testacea]